jgi:predicted PurR-regulated permease PerM
LTDTSPRAEDQRRRFPLGWVIVAVVLLALAVRTVDVLLVLFLAVILAVYLRAVADVLDGRLGIPRGWGHLVAVALTLTALVGAVLLLIPPLTEQVQSLVAGFPGFLAALDRSIAELRARLPLPRIEGGPLTSGTLLTSAFAEVAGYLRGAALPYLKRGVELIIEGVSVLVMALYLARHPRIYTDGLVALVPPPRRPLARAILADLRVTLRAWVVGQLIAMVILGVLTTLGLWLLGVPYFLAFGTFAAIAAIVPFFGTLFSTLIPALFALATNGLVSALLVAGLGVLVHLIEANFVGPYVMERQVNIPPVLTIAGVLLIGKLFGLAGLVVAVPILAVVMVLIRHVLLGQVYGDPVERHAEAGTVPAEAQPTVIARDAPPARR